MTMKSIATLEIAPTPMALDYSHGSTQVGTHASTMELFLSPDRKSGMIEWDIPGLGRTEHIGLIFEPLTNGDLALDDYDGVFSLPVEAVKFLRDQKFIVPDALETH